MHLRLATPADAAAIAAIYAPFVEGSATSFEARAPDADAIAARMTASAQHPWLVAEHGEVLGYAYASVHRPRAAYAWTVESSVYLGEGARGRGVGTRLLGGLLALLTEQGFALVLAGATLPNAASVRLHSRLGFEEVGIYRGIGHKHGDWHDVWWGQRALPSPRAPRPPLRPDELDPEVLRQVLRG